jgi:hypothetical protein
VHYDSSISNNGKDDGAGKWQAEQHQHPTGKLRYKVVVFLDLKYNESQDAQKCIINADGKEPRRRGSNAKYNMIGAKDGIEDASRYSARPGQSEHQTGLALDLASQSGKCTLSTCFKDTDEGKWLNENAWKYGFILRYPEGKEEITGYMFEPWHFRYVGKKEAKKIQDSGLTIEEYYETEK